MRSQPWFVALIVAAALLVRLLVPAGFMPVFAGGAVTIAVCTGDGPMQVIIPAPGATGQHDDRGGHATSPCAFADLALPAIGGADPVLLAAALLFVIAAALAAVAAAPHRRIAHLRPPLRGPPLPA